MSYIRIKAHLYHFKNDIRYLVFQTSLTNDYGYRQYRQIYDQQDLLRLHESLFYSPVCL